MNQADSQIEKGRKRLMVLIGVGLAIPLGIGLYFLYINLQLLSARGPIGEQFFLQYEEGVFSLFFLLLTFIGFFIGRGVHRGREWAYGLWVSVGFFVGGLIFFFSMLGTIASPGEGIPFLFLSGLVLLVSLQTAFDKRIRAYLNSFSGPPPSLEDKIKEIGEKQL